MWGCWTLILQTASHLINTPRSHRLRWLQYSTGHFTTVHVLYSKKEGTKSSGGGYFSTSTEILHISAWLASNLGSPATGVEGLSWIPIKLCQFVKSQNGKYKNVEHKLHRRGKRLFKGGFFEGCHWEGELGESGKWCAGEWEILRFVWEIGNPADELLTNYSTPTPPCSPNPTKLHWSHFRWRMSNWIKVNFWRWNCRLNI